MPKQQKGPLGWTESQRQQLDKQIKRLAIDFLKSHGLKFCRKTGRYRVMDEEGRTWEVYPTIMYFNTWQVKE
jgi:hypothetical protein